MTQVAGGLDAEALVAGRYDTRMFKLTPRARFVFAGGKGLRVRRDTERRVKLPTGEVVKVEVDASGHATHIHEDHRLHAVARPDTLAIRMRQGEERKVGDDVLSRLFYRLATRRS